LLIQYIQFRFGALAIDGLKQRGGSLAWLRRLSETGHGRCPRRFAAACSTATCGFLGRLRRLQRSVGRTSVGFSEQNHPLRNLPGLSLWGGELELFESSRSRWRLEPRH